MSASAIPCGGNEPLKVGDPVQIVPKWQDPGDENYARVVIEAPPNTDQVRIRTKAPGLVFQSTEWIKADRLVLVAAAPE